MIAFNRQPISVCYKSSICTLPIFYCHCSQCFVSCFISSSVDLMTSSPLCVDKPFVVPVGSVLLTPAVAGALSRVVRDHSDDVQQTGEQLQGEVEHSDPEAWRGDRDTFLSLILLNFRNRMKQDKDLQVETRHNEETTITNRDSGLNLNFIHVL